MQSEANKLHDVKGNAMLSLVLFSPGLMQTERENVCIPNNVEWRKILISSCIKFSDMMKLDISSSMLEVKM